MKKEYFYILSILTGIFLSIPWTSLDFSFVIFFSFLPLFFIEEHFQKNSYKFLSARILTYSFLSFLTWNIISIYWISYATVFGGMVAILLGAFYFTLIFWFYHLANRKFGNSYAHFQLVFSWIGFEYFLSNWELDFPWLNLGNAFANDIKFIQWYEYTGISGGSLWILIVNILIFKTLKSFLSKKLFFKNLIILLIIIILPISFSLYKFYNYNEIENPKEIILLQPNIDPYNEKFDNLTDLEQIEVLLNLSDSLITKNTDYIIAPETAFPNGIWWKKIESNNGIILIRNLIKKYPKLKFITGITLFKEMKEKTNISRKIKNTNIFYERYNTAIQIDSTKEIQFYHKSKLVVGVEKMPFIKYLAFLEDFALDMGGTVGTLGKQKIRSVFLSKNDEIKIAPVICYESIFGEFVTNYMKNGGNFICIITNDGWWSDSKAYKQHLSYARLRAIETRRSIARSANNGISAFINQKGEILKKTSWWKRNAIKFNINANSKITFYTIWGDFIGRIFGFLAIILLLYLFVEYRIKR